jgi:copper transport protein
MSDYGRVSSTPGLAAVRRPAVLAALAALLWVAAGWTGVASAHAILEASTPADGSVVPTSPPKVTLQFSEHVTLTIGSLRVFDRNGHRVDQGDASHGSEDSVIEVGLRPHLPAGTYAVAWQVISADTHPVHGGFLFSVRTRSAVSASLTSNEFGQSDSRTWQWTGDVLRWLGYGGAFLAAGGALFLTAIDDREDREPGLARVVVVAAVVGLVAALLQVPQEAALATGLGVGSMFHGGVLGQVLGQGTGPALVTLLVGLAVAVAAVFLRNRRVALGLSVVGVALVAVAFALTGHTRTTDPVWLTGLADAVHVAAAAVWTGGLVMLWLALRQRRRAGQDDPVASSRLVGRFSGVATVAILVVGAAGVVLAWREVQVLRALTSTYYGQLLIVKMILVAGVAGVGTYNHYRLVPAIERQPSKKQAWSRLRTTLRTEVIGVVAVLAVTSLLVNAVPAHTAAGVARVYSGTAPLGDGTVNVVIDPAVPGPAVMHAYLLDKFGRADDKALSVTVQFTLPAKSIGPFEHDAFKAGPGHYQVNGTLFTLTGLWTVTVLVRVDEFTENTATLRVRVHNQ